MSVRMSVGVIFCTGAVAASKSASNGSVIRSLKQVAVPTHGYHHRHSNHLRFVWPGATRRRKHRRLLREPRSLLLSFFVQLRYRLLVSTRQARVLIRYNFVNFSAAGCVPMLVGRGESSGDLAGSERKRHVAGANLWERRRRLSRVGSSRGLRWFRAQGAAHGVHAQVPCARLCACRDVRKKKGPRIEAPFVVACRSRTLVR